MQERDRQSLFDIVKPKLQEKIGHWTLSSWEGLGVGGIEHRKKIAKLFKTTLTG